MHEGWNTQSAVAAASLALTLHRTPTPHATNNKNNSHRPAAVPTAAIACEASTIQASRSTCLSSPVGCEARG